MLDGISYVRGDDDVLRAARPSSKTGNGFSRKIVGPEREAVYVTGCWYWVVFASVPSPTRVLTSAGYKEVQHERTDFVTGRAVKAGRYRADKRQMSARDLRRLGLVNG